MDAYVQWRMLINASYKAFVGGEKAKYRAYNEEADIIFQKQTTKTQELWMKHYHAT